LGNKPVFSLEFASTTPWYQFADYTIGIDQFGLSGKPNDLLHKFGLTAENIAKQIQAILKK
jgi:transketolase